MVEFAFIVPIICLVLFGIVQFGLTFHHYLQVTDAARVGARAAAVNRTSDWCGAAKSAVLASVGSSMRSTLSEPGRIACSASSVAIGQPFTITVNYPFDIDVIGRVVKTGDLSSQATERFE